MATTITADMARFSIGGVISRGASVLGRRFLMFFGLGLIAGIPGQILNYAMLPTINPDGSRAVASFSAGHWWLIVGSFLLGAIMTTLLQASITYGTVMDLSEQPTSLGRALTMALRVFFPLFGLGLILFLAVAFASLFLVVPGVMLGLAWIVAIPVRVVEQPNVFRSFGRSRLLTKGHRWAILGLGAIAFAGALVLGVAIGFVTAALEFATGNLLLMDLVNWLGGAITTVVMTTLIACLYFELRSEKEGIGPQQLASVFD